MCCAELLEDRQMHVRLAVFGAVKQESVRQRECRESDEDDAPGEEQKRRPSLSRSRHFLQQRGTRAGWEVNEGDFAVLAPA
jgi:hypothetical protein